jgi:hypothetical protein
VSAAPVTAAVGFAAGLAVDFADVAFPAATGLAGATFFATGAAGFATGLADVLSAVLAAGLADAAFPAATGLAGTAFFAAGLLLAILVVMR